MDFIANSYAGAKHPQRAVGRGFTLIELLVVVAIIATLMAVLLPSLSNAREQAKAIKCSANARSLSSMVMQYAAENNDYSIPNGDDPNRLPTGWFSKALSTTAVWQDSPLVSMYGYENILKMRACPSGQGNLNPAMYMTGMPYRSTNVANLWKLTKMSLVRNPAGVVMFGETRNATEATAAGQTQNNLATYGSQLLYLTAPRHKTTNTFSFMDGHAEQVKGYPPTTGFPSEGYWRRTYDNP